MSEPQREPNTPPPTPHRARNLPPQAIKVSASVAPLLRDHSGRKLIVTECPRHHAQRFAKAAALDPEREHGVVIGDLRHRLSAHRLCSGGWSWRWTCGRCGRRPYWLYTPADTDISGCQLCLNLGYRCNTRYEWRRDRWTAEQRRIYAALQDAQKAETTPAPKRKKAAD